MATDGLIEMNSLDCLFDKSRIGHNSISPEIKKPTLPRKPGKELA
jgi:hypothetical protein